MTRLEDLFEDKEQGISMSLYCKHCRNETDSVYLGKYYLQEIPNYYFKCKTCNNLGFFEDKKGK